MAMISCADRLPLVSIIWHARDRVATARENIAALQAQSYRNFELLLVGDGGSIDLFEAAAAADPRIRILHRETGSSGGSLLAALRQCRGDYIAVCPTDGHFTADAFQFAVDAFRGNPSAGIVCGENFLIDAHNNSLANVDVVTLLLTGYRPFLPAGFFRRQALVEVGLEREGWLLETFELELCTRLATDFEVLCFPRKIADCSSPAIQSDGLLKNASSALEQRLKLISNIFSVDGFWGNNEALLLESKANQVGILWEQFLVLGQGDITPLCASMSFGVEFRRRSA
jgi:glycosyltransferase involved in cell wall biosynthesis